jgi:hypothetical protein
MSINSRNNIIKSNQTINNNIIKNHSVPIRSLSPSPILFDQPKIINNSFIPVNNIKFSNIAPIYQGNNQPINIQNSYNNPGVNTNINKPQNMNNFNNNYISHISPPINNYLSLPKNYISSSINP